MIFGTPGSACKRQFIVVTVGDVDVKHTMVKVRSLESAPFSRYLCLCNVLCICNTLLIQSTYTYMHVLVLSWYDGQVASVSFDLSCRCGDYIRPWSTCW